MNGRHTDIENWDLVGYAYLLEKSQHSGSLVCLLHTVEHEDGVITYR